jgi:thymidylate kinase
MNNMRFICFVGIDGSGKTTLINNLKKSLAESGIKFRYGHLYHRPILLGPIKLFAQKIFLHGKHQFDGDYSTYRKEKLYSSQKFPLLSTIYSEIWLLDYSLQVFFLSVLPNFFFRPTIFIADRYIYDTLLNIRTSLHWNDKATFGRIQRWFRTFRFPDKTFWIDIDPEIAFHRKNDIPSLEYLIERRQFYSALSSEYNFIRLNGNLLPEELLRDTLKYLTD